MPLEKLTLQDPNLQTQELNLLKRLQQEGFNLAPLLVIPASLEEHFYKLNNLPAQLNKLFSGFNLKRADEDDIEDLSLKAQALIKKHYFLDEIIDMLYAAIQPLADRLVVRRPGQKGLTVLNGRPTLLAIKDIWVNDWAFEALSQRIEKNSSIALNEGPMIIQNAGGTPNPEQSQKVGKFLGQTVQIEISKEGITRVV